MCSRTYWLNRGFARKPLVIHLRLVGVFYAPKVRVGNTTRTIDSTW
jgi:hypothetical protein